MLNRATMLYLNGNIIKAYWSLKSVKFRFIQSLDPVERKGLRNMEENFFKARKENKSNAMAYEFEKYNEKIMDLLESYGYLIQKKKDSFRIS